MFNPFKILKGMFTPYFSPDDMRGLKKKVNKKCHECYQPIPDDSIACQFCHDKHFATIKHRRQTEGPKLYEREGRAKQTLPAIGSGKKKRPVSRNRRRMNGKGYSQSHTSYGHDDIGPSCSSSSSGSSDSGGGCGGGE